MFFLNPMILNKISLLLELRDLCKISQFQDVFFYNHIIKNYIRLLMEKRDLCKTSQI